MNHYKKTMKKATLAFTLVFGMLFAATTAILWYLEWPLYYGIVSAVIIVFLQYLISPVVIEMLFEITYDRAQNMVRPEIYGFLKETCDKVNIPVPELGIIDDGAPNAFTYGYTSRHAKIVVTRGLLDMLEEDEIKAVIAHELGHVKHNDFIMMMIISLIPMILYQIYIWTKKSDKGKPIYWIGLSAYAMYILSQYFVLFFSRIREYYADNFSRRIMGTGAGLKTALVKIAYGFTKLEEKRTMPNASLGIANSSHSEGFVLTYGTEASSEKINKLLKWDLNNIWSRWYELNSTHPLTVKRIMALEDRVASVDRLKAKEIGRFLLEAAISILPWIIVILAALFNYDNVSGKGLVYNIGVLFFHNPYLIILLGCSILLKYYYSYRTDFHDYTIEELLQREDASPVVGIPAVIEGKVIGKGVPGLFYSEDLIIDDGTSIMLVDYRQPLRILEFLFGVFMVDEMQEKQVKVVGWYKRGMRPFVCCKEVLVDNRKVRSFSYVFNRLIGYALIVAGIVKLFL